MLFTSAMGDWIANHWGIRTDLWIGGVMYQIALIVFFMTEEVKAEKSTAEFKFDELRKH